MKEFTKVAEIGDLQPGGFVHVEAGEISAVLFNINGDYYAIDATCTHRGGELSEGELDGDCIVCPLHGARYDVRTGVKEGGKPDQNVAKYPVQIQGTDILLGVG